MLPRETTVDAPLTQLVDVLAGEAPSDVAADIRRRLDTDQAFRAQAEPILTAWNLDLRSMSPAHAIGAGAAWTRVRQHLALVREAERLVSDESRSTTYVLLSGPTYILGVLLSVALGVGICRATLGQEWFDAARQSVIDAVVGAPAQLLWAGAHSSGRQIVLPNGSRAVLGPRSWVRYAKSFARSDRALQLEGEATFTVVSNPGEAPLTVNTGEAVIEGVDAVFAVRAYADQPEVRIDVIEGHVSVWANRSSGPTMVNSGQAARVAAGLVRVN